MLVLMLMLVLCFFPLLFKHLSLSVGCKPCETFRNFSEACPQSLDAILSAPSNNYARTNTCWCVSHQFGGFLCVYGAKSCSNSVPSPCNQLSTLANHRSNPITVELSCFGVTGSTLGSDPCEDSCESSQLRLLCCSRFAESTSDAKWWSRWVWLDNGCERLDPTVYKYCKPRRRATTQQTRWNTPKSPGLFIILDI